MLYSINIFMCCKMSNKYIGGYYWSGSNKITKISDLNLGLLTHLFYAFVEVNIDGSLTIQNQEQGFVDELLKYKLKTNPDLKLLFSFTNKNDSFSKVIADPDLKSNFLTNTLTLLQNNSYDGIDLDWEFPKDEDKENYVALLRDLQSLFNSKYILTAAVRAIPIYKNTGYIVPEMTKYLDIINIMTYDYFGSWSNTTGQNSPLYPCSLDSAYEREYLNVNASIFNWIKVGADKTKLALGIPFYGRTFTLADPDNHGIHAPSKGGGSPLSLTFYQIASSYSNYITVWNDEQQTPYKYKNYTWLSYDDERSVARKASYAVEQELRGVFVWHIGADDVMGTLTGTKQPLLTTINETIFQIN
ncbi:hypothetical protein ABEB36_002159 [Hypothenemus hampei]|uniref:GH18 domain-containing protein n=1 Tax=Hypothenemus hampei TaxID=57062 RepID=A0ABD1F4R8_HYPHA